MKEFLRSAAIVYLDVMLRSKYIIIAFIIIHFVFPPWMLGMHWFSNKGLVGFWVMFQFYDRRKDKFFDSWIFD